MGGEIGSNAPASPSLELLPPTGAPVFNLDFLARTDPNNLYPFLAVVPSGIFVAYYNEARILDEVTFETIKTLPNIPGAVNDPNGGRNYPLEGAMVLLPQYYPYIDPLGVLICGGSTLGGGFAIDNCVSMQPEAENAAWVIERMVRIPFLMLIHVKLVIHSKTLRCFLGKSFVFSRRQLIQWVQKIEQVLPIIRGLRSLVVLMWRPLTNRS